MTPTIEQVIAAIPAWVGRPVDAEPIAAGLTNTNWRVDVDGTPYFVRIPGAATDLLAVDRANELHNTRAAATPGSGRRVAPRAARRGTSSSSSGSRPRRCRTRPFVRPAMPARIADVLRRLHAGPRFRDDFDMFRTTERYLRVVDERGDPRSRRATASTSPQMPRIEAALAAHPLASVPCHNDLLADNYLDDGERLWIVDYEYSGNNDPTFELGNTAQELGCDDDAVRRAVRRLLRRGRPVRCSPGCASR